MADIRLGVIDDLEAVEKIVNEAYITYIERIGKKPAPMFDDYHDLIQKQLVHVIEEGNNIRGVLVLVPMEKYIIIQFLIIFNARAYCYAKFT